MKTIKSFLTVTIIVFLFVSISNSSNGQTVNTPSASGITLRVGEKYVITWSGFVPVWLNSTVSIDLYKGGSFYGTIASSLRNVTNGSGSYTWEVPAIDLGTDYKIKVSSSFLSAYSSAYFSIADPKILGPNYQNKMYGGATYDITWSGFTGQSNVSIDLYISYPESFVYSISSGTTNDGSFSWKIPLSLPEAINYKIVIKSLSDPHIMASTRDNLWFYTIVQPRVDSPSESGSTLYGGSSYFMQWSNFFGSYVKIELYKGNTMYALIKSAASNSPANFHWEVPLSIPIGSDYRFKITSSSNPDNYDFSDFFFTIEQPQVLFPSASGTTLYAGANPPYNITWSGFYPAWKDLFIDLYKAGVYYSHLKTNTENDGSEQWWFDNTLPAGTDYQFKIYSLSHPDVYDLSDFLITVKQPHLLFPSGSGIKFYGATSYNITWSDFPGSDVKIELVRAGYFINTIATSTPNDGSFSWEVPPSLPSDLNYQIRISSTANNITVIDNWESYFEIVSPTPYAPSIGNVTQPSCTTSTGSVVLNGLPSGTWTINPGGITGTGSSKTITGLSAGTYTFTVTNSSGYTSAPSGSVLIYSQPPTQASPTVGTITQPTCTVGTGSVVLSGLPAGNWTINPGGITGNTSSITIPGLLAGTYTFTVTNAAGCTSSATGNIVISSQTATPSAPTVGTITQPGCILGTGSVVLNGLPAGNWTINPGGKTGNTSSFTISGLSAGTYTFAVTNAAGCTSSATGNVVISSQPATPSAPTVGTIIQPSCTVGTGSVVLSGLPAGSWSINPGSITGSTASRTISDLTAGTYTYTVTNAAGCTSSATGNIVISSQPATPSAPTVGTITQPSCTVGTGTVVLNGLPSGNWTVNPGGITGSTASRTISGLSAGTYTYTVTNEAGCTSTATGNIVISSQPVTPPAPILGTITQPSCTVGTGSVILNGLPSGNWTVNPGGISGSTASRTISGLSAGTYTYTVTNAAGCTSSATGNVVISSQPATPSAPTVGTITQPTLSVATGSVILNGLPASGTWTINPGAITGIGTSKAITGLIPGTYAFTVTNSFSCTSAATNNLVINNQPTTLVEDDVFSDLKIYPNPTHGLAYLDLGDERFDKIMISIINIHGQVVSEKEYKNLISNQVIDIDFTELPYGLYYVKVGDGSHSRILNVIKF